MKRKSPVCMFVLFGLCLSLSGCSGNPPPQAEAPAAFEKGTLVKSGNPVMENAGFRMELDRERCAFSLLEKGTGQIWHSNPKADYEDPYAANITKTDLQSQLIITYKQDMTNLRTANSYSSSVLKKTFTVAEVKNGIRVDYTFHEGFVVPVVYTLAADGFRAQILFGEIEETQTATIVSIALLPYFGAAGPSEEGYLFVPDGSGALIDFNNGKNAVPPYSKLVYGRDDSLPNDYEISREEQISLPVFGMKRKGGAFLAIMEDGDGFSYINAAVSGGKTALNTVFATGVYRVTERLTILNGSLGTAGNSLYTALNPTSRSPFCVRYVFLAPGHADYSGMAAAYRDYLREKGDLKSTQTKPSLFAEFYGGVSKKMSFAGFQYEGMNPLTEFTQARDMLCQLKENGVGHITVSFQGIGQNSYNGKPQLDLKPVGKLGGERGFLELSDYTRENGFPLFAQGDFYSFSKSGSGLSRFFDVSKTLDMSASSLWYKGFNTNIRDNSREKRYLIKPARYQEAMKALLESAGKNHIGGIALNETSRRLSGDYASGGMERQQAISALREAVSQSNLPLLMKTPNAYLLCGADAAADIPAASSGHLLFDHDVPFLQMVLRGSLPYYGYALNLNNCTQDAFLKHMESLTGLSYAFMAASADQLQNTSLINLYGLGSSQIHRAAEAYQVFETVSGYVENQYAVQHNRVGSVAAMTYANGVTVAVNYASTPAVFAGATVPQRGWAVLINGAVALSGSEVSLFDEDE